MLMLDWRWAALFVWDGVLVGCCYTLGSYVVRPVHRAYFYFAKISDQV